jgi:hypothetical protein
MTVVTRPAKDRCDLLGRVDLGPHRRVAAIDGYELNQDEDADQSDEDPS